MDNTLYFIQTQLLLMIKSKEEGLVGILSLWLMVCKLMTLYNYMYPILYNTLSSDSDSTTIVSGVKGRSTAKSITPVINGVLTNHII